MRALFRWASLSALLISPLVQAVVTNNGTSRGTRSGQDDSPISLKRH